MAATIAAGSSGVAGSTARRAPAGASGVGGPGGGTEPDGDEKSAAGPISAEGMSHGDLLRWRVRRGPGQGLGRAASLGRRDRAVRSRSRPIRRTGRGPLQADPRIAFPRGPHRPGYSSGPRPGIPRAGRRVIDPELPLRNPLAAEAVERDELARGDVAEREVVDPLADPTTDRRLIRRDGPRPHHHPPGPGPSPPSGRCASPSDSPFDGIGGSIRQEAAPSRRTATPLRHDPGFPMSVANLAVRDPALSPMRHMICQGAMTQGK